MHYHDEIITAFLEKRPISKEKYYRYIKDYKKPDIKRKDVVIELHRQLKEIIDLFPVFNAHLWNLLFPDVDDYLEHIHICPVVGSEHIGFRETIKGEPYLFIDLICVANYTHIVSQMVYILKNHISFELSKLCILHRYPITSSNYTTLLDASAFINGLAYFLSWNEFCDQYQFYTEKYEPRKEQAFGLLAQALHVDNKVMQHKILTHISNGDIWHQFPAAAGMFYFDDTYRELGEKGVLQLFEKGPKNFVENIFR